MRESAIEARFIRAVEKSGGLCLKWTSPGNPGVPDRIIIVPGGRVIFTELKTLTGRLESIQKWQISRLRARGADVRVVKGLDEALKLAMELSGASEEEISGEIQPS